MDNHSLVEGSQSCTERKRIMCNLIVDSFDNAFDKQGIFLQKQC